ncbi:MAG: hypothetical protein OXN17_20775 [Candidatus Poribacteria bacterium]|nr:hypothetical protein [Candidatus Poribacteria bacterium]
MNVKDLVRGIHAAAASERAVGETSFLIDGVDHTWSYVAKAIAHSLETRPLPLHVPYFPLDVVGHFTEVPAKFRDEPATLNRRRMIDLKQQHWICDDSKSVRELAYRAAIPI